MSLYSKEIMKHFKYPKNVGKMENYSGCGKIGNLVCGDVLWLYIKIEKNKQGKEIIKQATFSTFGCVVAIANSSILTEMIKGKTIENALKITKEDIIKKMKKVPPIKVHCSVLAVDALHEAIYDYFIRNKKPIPKDLKKKHERIEKEKSEIEKRYKEWIKTEEKMHKEL